MSITMIDGDLSKRVFNLLGACDDGSIVFCETLSRAQVFGFFARQPIGLVAMKACYRSWLGARTLEASALTKAARGRVNRHNLRPDT